MSQVTLNPVFEGFSRKLGNIVFYKKNGKTFSRRCPVQSGKISVKQSEVRNAFTGTVAVWKNLSAMLKDSWNAYAKKSKKTGYMVFIGKNTVKFRNGEALEISAGTGLEGPKSFSAAPGNSGEIECKTIFPENSSSQTMHLIAQKVTDKILSPDLIFSEAQCVPEVSHTITGLESGSDYIVYAYISDSIQPDKIKISSCVNAISKPG